MELQGKASRIGNENRNSDRARNQIELGRVPVEKARFEGWAQDHFSKLETARDLTRVDIDLRHHQQRERLEARMRDQFGQAKAMIKAELHSTDRRLEAKGVRMVLRDVFGSTRRNQAARQEFASSLKSILQRDEQRQALAQLQVQEGTQLKKRMEARHEQLARGVEKARD